MPKNNAEIAAGAFDPAGNISEFQKTLADQCEVYTQCEFTFSDRSILEFYMAAGVLSVRAFKNRTAFDTKGDRPDRPHMRRGRKHTKGKEEVIRP